MRAHCCNSVVVKRVHCCNSGVVILSDFHYRCWFFLDCYGRGSEEFGACVDYHFEKLILNRLNSTSSALSSRRKDCFVAIDCNKTILCFYELPFLCIKQRFGRWKVSVRGETRLSLLEEGLGGKVSHLFPTTLRTVAR